MAEDYQKSKNEAIQEISKKVRLSFLIITFVIVTLLAIVLNHLFGSYAASLIFFLPDISVTMIVGGALFLSLVGLFISIRISRQVLRIIHDYSSRLERILNITRDLREEIYGDILLEKIMDYALAITSSQAGAILLLDGDSLVFRVAKGPKAKELIGTSAKKGTGMCGWVAENAQPIRIVNATQDERFNPEVDSMTGYETKTLLCVPLKTNAAVIGVLELLNKEGGFPYRERDEEIIMYLAEQAAISIIKTKFYEDQKNYEIHLTEMLLEAIDFQIPEKRGHSRRVARYSNIIARGLSMSEAERKRLYLASLLHDVGFLKINSDETYKKEEYTRHPVVGYEMIKPINFYTDIAPFILYHHERYDGYGYPAKLRGEDIPLEARIIAIAEAFDAMISPISYRIPVSFQEAIDELRQQAGAQFDQELVDIFVTNIEPQHVKV